MRNAIRVKRWVAKTSQPPVWAMVSISRTPGMIGCPGKWPSNTGEASGTWHAAVIRPAGRSSAVIRSTIWKYSSRITWPCRSGRLRGHQFVNVGAEILHHEVFVRTDLARIDVGRPLLQRHLDAESLVNGE